ncbi:hypothetical protein HDU97_004376 [Phlyctochytrium planicorne]|nr:hypothetical protein HDU97_004376 [Phlyctochytrium planicorne]
MTAQEETKDAQAAKFAVVDTTIADEAAIVKNWSAEEERRMLWKIDIRVVPMCLLLYLFSYLDRVNIGNARTIGFSPKTGLGQLERDLGMSGNDFNNALSVFFITYCIFEPVSNIILSRTSPSVWISRIAVTWGICAACLGAVNNYPGILSVRLLLGLCEAGLVPGITYYCSFWYRKEELASRIALWFGGASLATAFSSLLAYGIQLNLDGQGNLPAWRWIFIIEGLPTILLGIATYFVLPNQPGTSTFLTEREREIAVNRLKLDVSTRDTRDDGNHFNLKELTKVVLNPFVWVFAVSNFLSITPGYAFSFFLPTILTGIKTNPLDVNLFSAPPFVVSAVATIIGAFLSDKLRLRSPFIIGASILSLSGFFALTATKIPNDAYNLLFLVSLGGVAYPCTWAWLSNNIPSQSGRALALGIVLGVGNIGGGIASQIYRTEDRPWYPNGHRTLAICGIVNVFIVLGLAGTMMYLNKTKQQRLEAKAARGEIVTKEEEEFVYQL